MNISSYSVRLSGKAELPTPLEVSSNYHISLEGSIVSETSSDNEDGSYTRTYVFKPIKVNLLTPLGESIKAKDTRSNSQLIRSLIYKRYLNLATDQDFEEFYNGVSREIMMGIDDTIARYEKH